MQNIEISISDYLALLNAAEFGVARAEGLKSAATVRAWKEVTDRLSQTPLPSFYATRDQSDAAFLDGVAADCAKHGCD